MGLLGLNILGGIAGWLASILMGKNSSMGIILNVVTGIFGAFVGNWVFHFINGASITGFNLKSLGIAL